jgi:hypothetical protein
MTKFTMSNGDSSYLSTIGDDSYLPSRPNHSSDTYHDHNDLLTLLAVAQKHLVDYLPLTWQPLLGSVGRGASGEVRQSSVVKELGLAFKEFSALPDAERSTLQGMKREISILQHPPIEQCSDIISLQGICWKFDNTQVGMSPVLVYRLGRSLVDHLHDEDVSFEERLQYVKNIGRGMIVLHSSGRLSKSGSSKANRGCKVLSMVI